MRCLRKGFLRCPPRWSEPGALELLLKIYHDLLEDLFKGAATVFAQSAKIALNSSYIGRVALQKLYVAQGLFHLRSPVEALGTTPGHGLHEPRYICPDI